MFSSTDTQVADLIVQFRSWRDLGGVSFAASGGNCIANCAFQSLTKMLKEHPTQSLFRVFVTSDNQNFTSILVQNLTEWAPTHVGKEQSVKIFVSYQYLADVGLGGGGGGKWHSVDVSNERWSLDFSHVQHNVALLDWMVRSGVGVRAFSLSFVLLYLLLCHLLFAYSPPHPLLPLPLSFRHCL